METLRDFIDRRRNEIKAQISALKSELSELALAEAALRNGLPIEAATTKKGSKLTIKEMVIAILQKRPQGAEASELIDLIHNSYGEALARPSLSPQLSRLKDEGSLELSGKIWILKNSKGGSISGENEPPQEFGGSEVRGQVFPAGPPEGANPSTSSPIHHSGFSRDLDDEIPF